MLITCPECNGTVSDKAISCPHCGMPLKTSVTQNYTLVDASSSKSIKCVQRANKQTRRRIKLPNGYGSIKKLSGKRRKPYAVYPPVKKSDYDINGKVKIGKALGYFATYNEAMECLALYNQDKKISESKVMTFSKVYEKWFSEKFGDILPSENSTAACHISAYKKCGSLYDIPMDQIYKNEMQTIIDSCELGYSSLMNIKKLFNAVFKYAIENGIVEKNYASFVHVGKKNDNEHGVPLTEDAIKLLWEHSSDKTAQIILIYIYSGLRISELKQTRIDIENQMFIGGVKTTAGKERIVPFHDSIAGFVSEFNQEDFNPKQWRDFEFYPYMKSLGLEKSPSGTKITPHDLRHTFSWLADSCQMDDVSKHLILGHDLGSDVDRSVYGHRTIEQLRTEINKIKTP